MNSDYGDFDPLPLVWATWTGRVNHATATAAVDLADGLWETLCGKTAPERTYKTSGGWVSPKLKRCAKCEALVR